MEVWIQLAFENPTAEDEANLRALALDLTDNRQSVRVVACEDEPQWLVAELTMPTQPHDQAVQKIDDGLRVSLGNRIDTVIDFPPPRSAEAPKPRKRPSGSS